LDDAERAPAPAFAERLWRRRRAAGLTQEALAEAAGLSARTISDLERGVKHVPRRDTLRLLADALDLPAAERAAWEVERRRGPVRGDPARPAGAPSGTRAVRAGAAAVPRAGPPPTVGPAVGGNLPRALTSFVGRAREVGEVARLLERVQLVSLVGPGGVGKTRLAIEVAGRVAPPDGAWFVDLAPIADPGLVPSAAAAPFGLREAVGRSLVDVLAQSLRPRKLLLVLDNCEHLVEASAQLAGALLRACPALRIVATSREPLGLYGEMTWRVPPLSVPDPANVPAGAELADYEAVRLFAERARMVESDFALTDANASPVLEICHRLDGLPLAIELAAAHVRILPPRALLERLGNRLTVLSGGPRDLPARQRTMRGAVAWSYDLLDEDEQTLFRRLAVFVGGCTLSAVEAVCGRDAGATGDMLDRLESMVDKSLLRMAAPADDEPRFTMFETLREYGLEQLALAQEAEPIQRRHADYFLALAESAQAHLTGDDHTEWLARLELEHDNFRGALSRLRAWGDPEAGLRLAMALWQFWWLRGHFSEGRVQLEAVLTLLGPSTPATTHATALTRVAELARLQGDYAAARAHIARSLEIWRGTDDRGGTAVALRELGRLAYEQNDCAAARPYLEESLAMQRALGSQPGIALSLTFLALVHLIGDGDHRTANELLGESLGIARELGDRTGIAVGLLGLGFAAVVRGDRVEARLLLCRCLPQFVEVGPRSGIAHALDALAELDVAEGRPERALRLGGAAAALRETLNTSVPPVLLEPYERWRGLARQALGEPASAAAWAAGQASPLAQVIAEATARPS
jgi:predicted ATPase/DNA-binding XRE family transcriptional regulator